MKKGTLVDTNKAIDTCAIMLLRREIGWNMSTVRVRSQEYNKVSPVNWVYSRATEHRAIFPKCRYTVVPIMEADGTSPWRGTSMASSSGIDVMWFNLYKESNICTDRLANHAFSRSHLASIVLTHACPRWLKLSLLENSVRCYHVSTM